MPVAWWVVGVELGVGTKLLFYLKKKSKRLQDGFVMIKAVLGGKTPSWYHCFTSRGYIMLVFNVELCLRVNDVMYLHLHGTGDKNAKCGEKIKRWHAEYALTFLFLYWYEFNYDYDFSTRISGFNMYFLVVKRCDVRPTHGISWFSKF